jgi:butyrate kinase
VTKFKMLVINPGSTSTKVALFENDHLIVEKSLRHDIEQIHAFPDINDQLPFRKAIILEFLHENGESLESIDVFVGRGGMLRPLKHSGTYRVTAPMVADLKRAEFGKHASNLGAMLAFEFSHPQNKPAFIVNPVCIDEMDDIARVSGMKEVDRTSVFHALNQKAIALRHAKNINRDYHDLKLIVAHLGGGISVGWHHLGKVLDVNNALGGDGPFSPERCGQVPIFPLIDLCFSGRHTKDEIKKMLVGGGGLVSYLGTSNGVQIQKRVEEGDAVAKFYLEAMAYQIAKEIGSIYFVAKGEIDAILITGGLAYNKPLVEMLKERINPILPLTFYPGEDEMRALAEGAYRVLINQEVEQVY